MDSKHSGRQDHAGGDANKAQPKELKGYRRRRRSFSGYGCSVSSRRSCSEDSSVATLQANSKGNPGKENAGDKENPKSQKRDVSNSDCLSSESRSTSPPDVHSESGSAVSSILRRHSTTGVRGKNSNRMIYVPVRETLERLLKQEDTDGDYLITVRDAGPKALVLHAYSHDHGGACAPVPMPTQRQTPLCGNTQVEVRGTYALSLLLQELSIALEAGQDVLLLAESQLMENPVFRLDRLIRENFWGALTRTIDRRGMELICQDPKNRTGDKSLRVYVPHGDTAAYDYYMQITGGSSSNEKRICLNNNNENAASGMNIEVVRLPENITPEYVKTLDRVPGLLTLAMRRTKDSNGKEGDWHGIPFVVPGGRFNEMYGWDSYFETLGLINDGMGDIGAGMVENFCYQIHHYGKILNANRTYYLTRSQPPFLTDMARSVYEDAVARIQLRHISGKIGQQTLKPKSYDRNDNKNSNVSHEKEKQAQSQDKNNDASKDSDELKQWRRWLARAVLFAIREYYTVWTSAPRYHAETGLSLFKTTGIGMPPETESGHFCHIMQPHAKRHGVSVEKFMQMYNDKEVVVPELDTYFMHDRAVRESGHDTTYRFDNRCAFLLTVDLNSLLHKYETDIAEAIELLWEHEFKEQEEKEEEEKRASAGAKSPLFPAIPVSDSWAAASGLAADEKERQRSRQSTCSSSATSEHSGGSSSSSEDGGYRRVSDAVMKAHQYLWSEGGKADDGSTCGTISTVPRPLASETFSDSDDEQKDTKEKSKTAGASGGSGYASSHWETASVWRGRAARRRETMTLLMWDDENGLFFDYDIVTRSRTSYFSAVTFWTMWSGVATADQARHMVLGSRGGNNNTSALERLEERGGLVAGTDESRGVVSLDRPNRQWDYPQGWAPHQMLLWGGLQRYGYSGTARRMAYRWLFTIIKAFVDYNGVVPEKFDVVTLNHLLKIEYGNVGVDFKYVPREGFGWMNASFKVGLAVLPKRLQRCLGAVSEPGDVFKAHSELVYDVDNGGLC